MGDEAESTPICLGNYTDMLLTAANREYFHEFASEMAAVGSARPLVVVSKGRMSRSLAEALDDLNITIIIFHSQSFHRTALEIRTEKGPVLIPDQTFDAGATYRGLKNITPVHFWRPITRKAVPSTGWAVETVRRLKASGYRCSVALGLSVGAGIAQSELVQTGLLEQPTEACDEMWDAEAWADITAAAVTVGYPVYRSTSCAIALASGKAEALGVWDRQRGAAERCWPCNCPATQRTLCQSKTLRSEAMKEPLAWIADHLGGDASRLEALSGRRVRVSGEIRQSMISLVLHKYQIELLPESISAERAWLGRFGRKGSSE
ncbi:hypothetical protein [Acrocarpospora macrocephala]|nr:hypothetical protein [Acrocarpospora macrocephala]